MSEKTLLTVVERISLNIDDEVRTIDYGKDFECEYAEPTIHRFVFSKNDEFKKKIPLNNVGLIHIENKSDFYVQVESINTYIPPNMTTHLFSTYSDLELYVSALNEVGQAKVVVILFPRIKE